ncbi:3-hydroxyisobutyryl-CoA hydrolase [Saccharomycopsis crataegensis]|uniref:3-hydroxyisobutyryl-CoA hydrolase n=1 Tax=Saccharomycopsis crataegensis TaxID=43959 RepID=A0AAV5QN58_9ASCO|nr:3-hydroxyisobutyryl-CoA hydrolase [Saccharomycopsis crataegensis]
MLRAFKSSRAPMASRLNQYVTRQFPKSSYSTVAAGEQDVIFKNENTARIVTLNRPNKLNALNTSIVNKIIPRLLEYRASNSTNAIIINSSSSKAFCAGGDVAQAAKDVIEGNPESALDFFYKEYSMNYLLSIYPKPIVSYMDGITMGGGVGLSVHAPFRVATENTRIAMPEMDIGFFPDVGTSFFLPRMDGNLGKYLAFTGESLNGVDNLIAGFATHYVPSVRLEELTKRLGALNIPQNELLNSFSEGKFEDISAINEKVGEYHAIVNNAIEEFTDPIPSDHKFKLSNEQRNFVDKIFAFKNTEEIFKSLIDEIHNVEASETTVQFAQQLLDTLQSKSLLSLKIANELLNAGANYNNKAAITQELIVAENLLLNSQSNDFIEGVSKKLIEKTNAPTWKYKELSEIPIQEIHSLFTNKSSIKYSELQDFGNGQFLNSYRHYPFNMGLPSETEIKDYITGNDGSKRDYAPTRKEVLNKFTTKYHNKVGVNWKVNNVLERKTKEHEFDSQYINWIEE